MSKDLPVAWFILFRIEGIPMYEFIYYFGFPDIQLPYVNPLLVIAGTVYRPSSILTNAV